MRDFVEVFGRTPIAHKMVTGAETLDVEDHFVRAAGGTYAITLPPVSLANGIYAIYRDDGTAGNVTVQDQDETPSPYTSAAMTAEHDYVVVAPFGGYCWIELAEKTT